MKKQKLIKHAVLFSAFFVAFMLIIFHIVAFLCMDLNPANWPVGVRFAYGIFGSAISSGFSVIIIASYRD